MKGEAPLVAPHRTLPFLSPREELSLEKKGCVSVVARLAPCGWCEVVHFAAEGSGLPRIIAAVQVHISTRDA